MLRVKIVASLAWEGEKRRPEIRLRFTGYVQRLELWAMWTKLLKTGFNNIEMSKDFNYNMSSYVFSREDNYNGSLIVKILFFFSAARHKDSEGKDIM